MFRTDFDPSLRRVAQRVGATTLTALLLLLLLLVPSTTYAQAGAPPAADAATATGVIQGHVTGPDGGALAGVQVELADLHRVATTDAKGDFRFARVPPGTYLLALASAGQGSTVKRVEVRAGEVAGVEMVAALVRHDDEIVVTGSAVLRSQLELAQPTTVLTDEELSYRLQPSLGETLAQEPGISSTFFGAGASRPVIRGLGGDRVRMLQDGLGAGDASSTSPDHAVANDPAGAERIEVLRGPSTLLYGSSAIGGVVNVIDQLIPDLRPASAFGGYLELRGGSVDDERTGVVDLSGGSERWGWHADLSARATDDYDIPGAAAVEEEGHEDEEEHADEAFGTLPNSDLETASAGFGVTRFFGDAGYLGVSASGFDSEYGVPGGHGHEEGHEEGEEGEEEEEGEEGIRIDMERRRFDLQGGLTRGLGFVQGVKVRFGVVDYEHRELEGAAQEVGTTFFNDSWEGRVEAVQRERGPWSGSFGLQAGRQELEAVGEEAFIPLTDQRSYALFTFQEIARGKLRIQLGGRFESQDVEADDPALPSRSFTGASGSLGVVYLPRDDYSLGLSLARSTKLPNAEELYSDGPHFATRSFEVGNPDLGRETSLGLDLTLRKKSGRLRGELSFFANRFSDFIYQDFTGEEEDGLPILRYTQDDAEFVGAELDARLALWETDSRHLDLSFLADYVRAELRATDEPLPRIPPRRVGLGLHYHTDRWHAFAEARRVAEQDRTAANETATDGYTLVGAGLSYRLIWRERIYDLTLLGRNLTDEEARNHVSFLKDEVPLPGRDVSLVFRWTF